MLLQRRLHLLQRLQSKICTSDHDLVPMSNMSHALCLSSPFHFTWFHYPTNTWKIISIFNPTLMMGTETVTKESEIFNQAFSCLSFCPVSTTWLPHSLYREQPLFCSYFQITHCCVQVPCTFLLRTTDAGLFSLQQDIYNTDLLTRSRDLCADRIWPVFPIPYLLIYSSGSGAHLTWNMFQNPEHNSDKPSDFVVKFL
jgi:hypothetical protein